MSIFGKMDAATIPTNPYFVEKGEYLSEVTKSEYRTIQSGDKAGMRQLLIEFTINDENSQYLDRKVKKTFDLVDEDMTAEKFATLPADEKKTIHRNMSALKRTLCGNESSSNQKGLGVPVDDLNDPNWDPAVLVGTKTIIGITNYGPSNEGVNVAWVNLAE